MTVCIDKGLLLLFCWKEMQTKGGRLLTGLIHKWTLIIGRIGLVTLKLSAIMGVKLFITESVIEMKVAYDCKRIWLYK